MGAAIDVRFAKWGEVQLDCADWALEIARDYVPDLVVFLAKSGFLFAETLSACFGCPMVDLEVSRPTNGGKDAIAKAVPRVPRPLLAAALRSRAMYGYHEGNPDRELVRTERYGAVDFSAHHRILLVDDSVDTGWSMLRAIEALREDAPGCEVRTAGYCVVSVSEGRVVTDFWRHRDAVVVTATSRYSEEYPAFLSTFDMWKRGISRYES